MWPGWSASSPRCGSGSPPCTNSCGRSSPASTSLPSPQARALDAAFGIRDDGAPDQFLVGLAALTVISTAATSRPLLIIVDDAQWLDQESADAIGFVARRLYADRICMVMAVRDSIEDRPLFDGLPSRRLEPLSDAAARIVLDAAVGATARRSRRRPARGRGRREPTGARRVRPRAVGRRARRCGPTARAARCRAEAGATLPAPGRGAATGDPAAPARRRRRTDRRRGCDLACRPRARLRRACDRAGASSRPARHRVAARVPPPPDPLRRLPRRQRERPESDPRGVGRRVRRAPGSRPAGVASSGGSGCSRRRSRR